MTRCKGMRFEGVMVFSVLFVLLVFCVSGYGEDLIDTDGDGIADSVDNCPLTSNPDQADTDMPEGAISYWKFDEGSGNIANDSADSNDGTITGASWTSGMTGGALSFDGVDDYVSMSDAGFPAGDSARTIEAWFKTGIGDTQVIFYYGIPTSESAIYILIWNGKVCGPNWGGYPTCGGTLVSDNQWHHVAFVYDGAGNVKLYLDGSFEVSYTWTFNTILSGLANISGSMPYVPDRFNGSIDEVAIYDRAISESEAYQHYQSGLGGSGYIGDGVGDVCDNCPVTYNPDQRDIDTLGVVSYWALNEGSGSVANDLGGSNDGMVTGGAVWTSGMAGGALSFDGVDDYVSMSDAGFPAGDSARTIEAWFKTGIGDTQVIFYYGVPTSESAIYILIWNGKVCGPNWGGYPTCGGTLVSDNQWHHVAFVYDGAGNVKLYLDGSFEVSYTWTFNTILSGLANISGSMPYVPDRFNGSIDEVAIYDRAISASEAYQHYQHGLNGGGYLGDGNGDVCDDDQDNDGYASPLDCDDSNASVNPGATEVVNNGMDDDCNPNTPAVSASGNAYNYPTPLFRATLSLNVNASSLETGYLRYYYTRNRLSFVSTSITGISVSGGVATVTGAGNVNGTGGYTFTATITEGTADAIGLVIKKSDGTAYYSVMSKAVASGNYTVVGQ